MPTRIYLREIGRCAKPKFKKDSRPSGAHVITRESDVVLEIDHKLKTISIVENRYGYCGVVKNDAR